jgi:hypothetical protein
MPNGKSNQLKGELNHMENLQLFKILTTEEYNASKESGTWPLASIVAVRSDYPDADGHRSVYFLEVVSDVNAPWVNKGTRNKEGDQLSREVEDIKHAAWAAVEVFHQHRNTVMESGCHILGFDENRPEVVGAGAVAAWCRNPKFARFAPREGWSEIIWRNGHYIGGAELQYGQEAKHDYEDMLVTHAANFHIAIPPFLAKWAETVVDALEAEAEESKKVSGQRLTGWTIRQDVRQAVVRHETNGSTPPVGDVSFLLTDGTSMPLSEVSPADVLYFYRRVDGQFVYQAYVAWDGSSYRRAMIAENARRGFAVSLNEPLAL